MKRKEMVIILCVAFLLTIFSSCRSNVDNISTKKKSAKDAVAWVGGEAISKDDIEAEINSIPPRARIRFRSEQAKNDLIDKVIQRKMMVLAAKEADLQNYSNVQAEITKFTENV